MLVNQQIMQEKIESNQAYQHSYQNQNNFFLPEILPLTEQRQRLLCPNHNQAYSVCISAQCSIPGLMCLDIKCQCRKIHYKCHHILLDRVLQSIQKHQKEIPQKVKETYKTIYQQINDMIGNLSKLRTKFERQQQYFGLREQELQFMDLIYQKKINEVNGKIISSVQKTFDTEVQLSKQSKQEIVKDFQSKRQQFHKMCLDIQKKYLQQSKQKEKLCNQLNLFKDSVILTKSQQITMLQSWLNQVFNNPQKKLKSNLLFRASQHQFSASQFHKACDNKKNTITIIKNQYDKIIGGYASAKWSSSNLGHYGNGQSFLFSIKLKQKYNCFQAHRSIYCQKNKGPGFGNFDIDIKDKCNTNNSSYGDLGCDYNIKVNNQFKYKYQDKQTRTLFTGNPTDKYFKVEQYEIYQILQK